MSSAVPPTQSLEPDPFRYGWRDVPRTRPDGTEEWVQVPLTLLDVLHPQEGDRIPENSRHERHRRHFHNVLEKCLARQPTRLSLSDCLIDWDRADLRGHCPDLIVLEREEPWPWGSWGTLHVREEGARPLLIIELVSPSTRVNDVDTKVEHYHRAGVPLYVIVDEEEDEGPLRLVAYRHQPEAYVPVPLDEKGRLFLEPLALYVAVLGDRVALYDAATGQELGDYVAVSEALEAEVRARQAAEEARQAAEEARRAAEEARAAAEARSREDAEARQAAEQRQREEAQARQGAEQARLAAEAQAREQGEARQAAERAQLEAEQRALEQTQGRLAAEARNREMEVELQRLRGTPG